MQTSTMIILKYLHLIDFSSYVRDGILYLKPILTSDVFGEDFITSGHWDIWGGDPASLCTMASFYGCERVGAGGNILNPVMSAR